MKEERKKERETERTTERKNERRKDRKKERNNARKKERKNRTAQKLKWDTMAGWSLLVQGVKGPVAALTSVCNRAHLQVGLL